MKLLLPSLVALILLGGCGTLEVETGSDFVGNKTTYVFHTKDCPLVVNISSKSYFSTRQEAIDAGYTPDESPNGCTP